MLDRFSVADAYLSAVLNWAPFAGVELARWPMLQAYVERMAGRPSVRRARAEEWDLYQRVAA